MDGEWSVFYISYCSCISVETFELVKDGGSAKAFCLVYLMSGEFYFLRYKKLTGTVERSRISRADSKKICLPVQDIVEQTFDYIEERYSIR